MYIEYSEKQQTFEFIVKTFLLATKEDKNILLQLFSCANIQ